MDYIRIYELEFIPFPFWAFLLPIGLFFLGGLLLKWANRLKNNTTFFSIGSHQLSYEGGIKFFASLLMFFAFIFLVGMLYHLAIRSVEKKQVKELVESENINVVEGSVSAYSAIDSLGAVFESFALDSVKFSFSSNDGFYSHSIFPLPSGTIQGNGQHLRIAYFKWKGRNVIYAIEARPTP